jgi:SpoVK/Ycf46/Vps4 family AAA+-type ATPase
LTGELIRTLDFSRIGYFMPFGRPKNQLWINKYLETGALNPIYNELEDYLVQKFIDSMENTMLVPKEGDISFSLSKNFANRKITDDFQDHKIVIGTQIEENQNSGQRMPLQIIIESKTASLTVLKQYIKDIAERVQSKSAILKIFKPAFSGDEKQRIVSWETYYCKTNKTIQNTILSTEARANLIDDVQWFVQNEQWYNSRGIPYKRGYIIHGPPGTGKTSTLKAIANHHLPIFILDIGNFQDNAQLESLINEINYHTQNKRYMLVMEDFDRSELLKRWGNCRVTEDCLLNIMDGISETYGRLLFITANDVDIINERPAMVRPGRIDKKVKLDLCDNDQIQNIFRNFYPDHEPGQISLKKKVSPAVLMQIMQRYPNGPKQVIETLSNGGSELDEHIVSENFKSSAKNTVNSRRIKRRLVRETRTIRNLKKNLDPGQIEKNRTRLEKLEQHKQKRLEIQKKKTAAAAKKRAAEKKKLAKQKKAKK